MSISKGGRGPDMLGGAGIGCVSLDSKTSRPRSFELISDRGWKRFALRTCLSNHVLTSSCCTSGSSWWRSSICRLSWRSVSYNHRTCMSALLRTVTTRSACPYHLFLAYWAHQPRACRIAGRGATNTDPRGEILWPKVGQGVRRRRGDGLLGVRVLGDGAGVGGGIWAWDSVLRRLRRSEPLTAAQYPPSSELPARHDGVRAERRRGCLLVRPPEGSEDGSNWMRLLAELRTISSDAATFWNQRHSRTLLPLAESECAAVLVQCSLTMMCLRW